MALSINTNVNSIIAQTNLDQTQVSMQTSMERLSSGLRINSAEDDPAGLAIATRMQAQVNGMNQAQSNANNAISLAQTADGALGQVTNALQTMRSLAVQAANGTNTSSDRASLDLEFQQLSQEIQQITGGTTFNGQTILGSNAGTLTFQVGANTTSNDSVSITTTNMATGDASMTAVYNDNIGSAATAGAIQSVINDIDAAINDVNNVRATFGAQESRFQTVVSNLQVSVQNQQAAYGRIMDADFASETANLSRTQVLQQAGTAMVAQANQEPNQVLKLLQ